jgi:hypothetical protein
MTLVGLWLGMLNGGCGRSLALSFAVKFEK